MLLKIHSLLFLSLLVNTVQAQDTIHHKLEEETIISRNSKKIKFKSHNLIKHRLIFGSKSYLEISNPSGHSSIGTFIPCIAADYLYIKEITFPIQTFNNKNTIPELELYIGLKYNTGKEAVIAFKPKFIAHDSEKLIIQADHLQNLKERIEGFYIFVKCKKTHRERLKDNDLLGIVFSDKNNDTLTFSLDHDLCIIPNVLDNQAQLLQYTKDEKIYKWEKRLQNWNVKVSYWTPKNRE